MSENLDNLPFDITQFCDDRPPLVIGKVTIPAYGSLTVEESARWEQISEQSKSIADLSQDERDKWWMEQIVAMLLQSRFNKRFKPEHVNQLPRHALEQIFTFFVNESRRWAQPNNLEAAKKKLAASLKVSLEAQQNVTGQESSGNSEDTTQTSSDSASGALVPAHST